MREISIDSNLYQINHSQETVDEVLNKIINWIVENGATSSEIIMQTDDCIISAPELLADIVNNILKPKFIKQL